MKRTLSPLHHRAGTSRPNKELLNLKPIKEIVTGRDIFAELEKSLDRAGSIWSKLVSVATNGARQISSKQVELVG